MKKLRIAICAVFALALVSSTAVKADTLAGSNFAAGTLGVYMIGDNDYIDTGYLFSGLGNFNVMPRLDIVGELSYMTASEDDVEVSSLRLSGEALYWFKPGEKFNPYAGGGLLLDRSSAEVEVRGRKSKDSDTNVGIIIDGGVEFDIAPKWTARAGAGFILIDGESDVGLKLQGAYNVAENVYISARFDYWIDNGDVILGAGGVFKF